MNDSQGDRPRPALRAVVIGIGITSILATLTATRAADGWRSAKSADDDQRSNPPATLEPALTSVSSLEPLRLTDAEQGPEIVPATLPRGEGELELPELDQEDFDEIAPVPKIRSSAGSRVRRTVRLPERSSATDGAYRSSGYAAADNTAQIGRDAVGGYRATGNCGGCDDPWCGGCGGFCRPQRCGPPACLWVRAEYLLWWTQGMNTPPLVTTSPPGTPQFVDPNASLLVPFAGAIGQSGTQTLYGGEDFFDQVRSGGRFTVGTGIDWCHGLGLEAEYFGLGQDRERIVRSGVDGNPILARPFFDVDFDGGTGGQASQLISFEEIAGQVPFAISGSVRGIAKSSLQSYGVRFRQNLCCEDCGRTPCCTASCLDRRCSGCLPSGRMRWDFLLGYRSTRLNDSVGIRTNLFPSDSVTSEIAVRDSFTSRNEFHGVDLGWMYEFERCRWSVDVLAKVAFGNNRQHVRILGSTTTTAVDTTSRSGGLLAQPTNIGDYSNGTFSVIPEAGVTLGYALSCNVKLTAGYTFMYWNNVVRAGEQIDFGVDSRLLADENAPGATRPRFVFRDGDFWAQGLNFGVACRW